MIRSVNPAVKPAGAWHPRPRSRARRNPYWTNKRVLEGLRRAARDIWNNDTSALPSSTQAYTRAIMRREHCPPGKGRLLYPSANRVLVTYESMNHAWYALGFLVETKVRRVAHDLITPEIEGLLQLPSSAL